MTPPSTHALPATAAKPFFGWRVVRAAFVLAVFGWGVGFYGPPVFLHAVMVRTGWPLALVSSAVTVHFLFGALLGANLPALYRRFGISTVTIAAAAGLGIGVLGWGIASEPWQLFAAALLSGASWTAMAAAALNAIVAPWFNRARPAALAMAYNGGSVGGVVFSPLWVALIDGFGFAAAGAMVGAVMLLVVWTLSRRVFSKGPAGLGQSPDGDAPGTPAVSVASPRAIPLPGSALWRNRRFLTLAIGMAVGLFAQIGLLAHLFSLLVPALGTQGAGLAMGLATACAVAGRTVLGWLLPAGADRRLVACASYAVQLAGSLVLIAAAGGNVPLLLLGVMLFGSGIGNATSLPPLIAQVEFVEVEVQRVVSLIVAIGQATFAFAPITFGIVRSIGPGAFGLASGEGTVVFILAAIIQVGAIAAFLAGRDKARPAP